MYSLIDITFINIVDLQSETFNDLPYRRGKNYKQFCKSRIVILVYDSTVEPLYGGQLVIADTTLKNG